MSEHEIFFFSLSDLLIPIGKALPFDLYINSSSIDDKKHFVRIKKRLDIITSEELRLMKQKYFCFYMRESQRTNLFKVLESDPRFNKNEKVDIVKSFTIKYLENLFNPSEHILESNKSRLIISGAKDAVIEMINYLSEADLAKTQDLISTLSVHDFYTFDHSINVSLYAVSFYKFMHPKASKKDLIEIGLAGLLHDIGKVKISNGIINKPDKLNYHEFCEMMKHPVYGAEMFENEFCQYDQEIDFKTVKAVIYEHHENFNGTGYPDKVVGEKITYHARLVAIVDFYDAVTTKRAYSSPLTTEDAVNLMSKSSGRKLDPKLFEIFLKCIKQLIFNGKENRGVADDFDPCQPQKELPYVSQEIIANRKIKKAS